VTLIRSVDCAGVHPECGFRLETAWRSHAVVCPTLAAARAWKQCLATIMQ
jgi:hypothetical protein